MIWTTAQGHVLIEGEAHPIYLSVSGQGIRLPTGAVIHAAADYREVTRTGEVVATYSGPLSCTLDDYLYVCNIHVVMGTVLSCFLYAENGAGDSKLEETVLLRDLTPYAGADGDGPLDRAAPGAGAAQTGQGSPPRSEAQRGAGGEVGNRDTPPTVVTFGRGQGDPDGPPQRARSSAEMYFAVSLIPCPGCGRTTDPSDLGRYLADEEWDLHLAGQGDAWAMYGDCPHCRTPHAFTFLTYGKPWESECRPGELGGVAPSQIIRPAQFLAEFARVQALVRPDPTQLALDEWELSREANHRALICLRELLKFVPEGADAIPADLLDPAERADRPQRYRRAWLGAQLDHHLAVQARIVADLPRIAALQRAARRGRRPRGRLTRATRQAHQAWLKRGQRGAGRLVLTYVQAPFERIGAAEFSGALLEGVEYADVDLAYASLDGAELRRATLTRATLTCTSLRGARITGGTFTGAALALAKFEGAHIEDTDFTGADLDRSQWAGARVRGATFTDALFGNACFDGAVFTGCIFRGADLAPTTPGPRATTRGARFEDCDFRDTGWDGRDLSGAVFVRCALHGVRGRPAAVEGLVIEEPDLSLAADGSGRAPADAVLALWSAASLE